MILYFRIEKVAQTRYRAFGPDPKDPNNTVDLGRNLEELTLEVIPDQMRGGKGLMVIQLNDADHLGTFQPGQRVKVELTVEG